MNEIYQELVDFKYQSNLLYAQGILKKEHIDFKSEESRSNKLFVKADDREKALAVINQLDLDESNVNEDSDGYLDGYNEWADKRFVSGYFTGGKIPLWMYNKTYAKFYGPFIILTGSLAFFGPFSFMLDDTNWINVQNKWVEFVAFSVYVICGILLTMRGFGKKG